MVERAWARINPAAPPTTAATTAVPTLSSPGVLNPNIMGIMDIRHSSIPGLVLGVGLVVGVGKLFRYPKKLFSKPLIILVLDTCITSLGLPMITHLSWTFNNNQLVLYVQQ